MTSISPALLALALAALSCTTTATAAERCPDRKPPANSRVRSSQLDDLFGKVAPADRPLRFVVVPPAAPDAEARHSLEGLAAEAKRFDVALTTLPREAALAASPDALLFAPDGGDWKGILADAAKRGIPTVAVGAQGPGARLSVAADQPLFGAMAAEYLHELFPLGAGVAQLSGPAGAPENAARAAGFAKEIGQYPTLQLADSVATDGTKDRARDAVTALMAAHPDIKAIYAGNDDMAAGAVEALKGLKLFDVVVVGTGGTDAGRAALAQRATKGTVARFPEKEGGIAVQAALRLLACQTLPAWIVSPQVTMTPKSLEDFASATQ
ncbi:sugar ABC transporter substrate-binding protein [Aureimonas leprariae]|nr:substrate-binding domain-containing protein [Aureimonas leprariae]